LFLEQVEQTLLQLHQHRQQQAMLGLIHQHRLILRQLLRLCQPMLNRLQFLVQQPPAFLQFQPQIQRHLNQQPQFQLISLCFHQRQQLILCQQQYRQQHLLLLRLFLLHLRLGRHKRQHQQ
jgi:hypothetical protein